MGNGLDMSKLLSGSKIKLAQLSRRASWHAGQRGAVAMVGIVLLTVIILAVVIFGYFALTSKSETTLTVVAPEIRADDLLTKGKSNNELLIDTQIIAKGIDRDESQRKLAEAALADEPLPVGDGVTTATTVEAERLSRLQTEFIAEADRRLKALNDLSPVIQKLTVEQKPVVSKTVSDETTALTGLKAKAAAETTTEAFLVDRTALEAQYINYSMVIAQVNMLRWANDQSVLVEKVNVLGGKFQERLNEASDKGSAGVATAQISLNSYQTNKTAAKAQTAAALKLIAETKPNTFNANRAVQKNYYNQLATSHNELVKAQTSGKELYTQIRAFQ